MNSRKLYFLISSFLLSFGGFWSQNPLTYHLVNIQDTFRFQTKNQAFLFACPIDFVNTDSLFLIKVKNLLKSDKRLKSAEVHLLFYKPTMSADKFHKMTISGLDSLIKLDGILQCFVLNFPCDRIDSSFNRVSLTNKYWYKNYSYKVTEVIIYDNMCTQNLGERLFYYGDMLKELISPKYSDKEEIEFLKSRVLALENSLSELNKSFNTRVCPDMSIEKLETKVKPSKLRILLRKNKV